MDVLILTSAEVFKCVLSNELPDACPITEFRQIQEMQEGGAYTDTCRLSVPATHADAVNIAVGNYILFKDLDGYWNEYKIVMTERNDSVAGNLLIATGENAFYELLGDRIEDKRPETTASAAVISALADTRWGVGTVADLGTHSTRIYKTSVLAGLVKIATAWGGELRFRVDVVGNTISARYVDLLATRGSVTGKRFEYKKDLIDVWHTINTQNIATALIGRGKGVEISGGTETEDPAYGRCLEFTDVVWTIAGGDPADKPAGQNYIGDDTAAAAYGAGGRHIYAYVSFPKCTDAEELLTLTYAELQNRKIPQTTYEMSVITLEGISGYSHEAVRLGDTVNIINTAVSPSITGTARVIRIDRNWTNLSDCYVNIGNYIPTISTTTASLQSLQKAITEREGIWDRATAIQADTSGLGALEYKIDLLKTQLAATTSGISTDASGNLIIENAGQTKALKLGAGIFAIANTKTGGEYDWRTFGDGDGFTADEINAGTLTAGILFAGTLSGASGTFLDLIAGLADAQRLHLGSDAFNDPYIKVYDNAGNLCLSILKSGITFPNASKFSPYTIGDRTGIGIFVE